MSQNARVSNPFYLNCLEHPWLRFFARMADLSLYLTLYFAVQHLFFRWNPEINLVVALIASYIAFGFMVMLEPVLLALLGTTPGKWIFGIGVYTVEGHKLSYQRALWRTVYLFKSGLGFGFPVYNIVRMAHCRFRSLQRKPMEWDEGQVYVLRDAKVWRRGLFVFLLLAVFAANILIMLEGMLPLHRGDITPEQYVENIEDVGSRQSMLLTRDVFADGQQISSLDPRYTGITPPRHMLELENGNVVRVTFEIVDDRGQPHDLSAGEKSLLFQAFFGAQPGLNCFEYAFDDVYQLLSTGMESYEHISHGMRFVNEVETTGYAITDGMYFAQSDHPSPHFRMIFTMERLNVEAH